MHSQNFFSKFKASQSSDTPISLESLANFPERLVTINSSRTFLKDYNCIAECRCYRAYDRTNTKHDELVKNAIKIPYGFKTPLDFFESVTTEYITKQFYSLPEIHLVSFGSGRLLRELIIISKLIKLFEKTNSNYQAPPIYLHAIDRVYQTAKNLNPTQSKDYICIEQFRILIKKLNLNVTLLTYTSIGEYNRSVKNTHPTIIFAIDFPFRYDSTFPPNPTSGSFTEKKYTLEGKLDKTKNLVHDQSLCITLTHMETNAGMFLILEKKENGQWKKEWVHTISSMYDADIPPPPEIQEIITDKEHQFFLSDMGKLEIEQIKRFKSAPLSLAVKENDFKMVINLMALNDTSIINAQSSDGFTALHWAAMQRYSGSISKFIKHGADASIRNCYGRTAYDYYFHQVTPEDFKDNIDEKFYHQLNNKYPSNSSEIMPEFYEVYHYYEDIESAFGWTRNQCIDKFIFHQSVPKVVKITNSLFAVPAMEIKPEENIKIKNNNTYINYCRNRCKRSLDFFIANDDIDTLNQKLSDYPDNVMDRLARAKLYLNKADYKNAYIDFKHVYDEYPENETAASGVKKCEVNLCLPQHKFKPKPA